MTDVAKGVVGLAVDESGLSGSLKKMEGVFGGFGGKAGAGFAVAFTAAAAVGGILARIGSDLNEAYKQIATTTGATGAPLAALDASFRAVASGSVSSFKDVGVAVGGLNQRLGLTGAPLDKLTGQVLDLSRITKTDLGENIASVSGVMNNWGVKTGAQSAKLDELFRVSQATGVTVGDLAGQMTASGAPFRAAGLTFDQTAGIIGLLSKNGLSASTVVPALSKALAVAAKEGKPASQVFADTFNAIKNAPTDTKAAGDALAVFGAKAGPKLAQLIREGKLSYQDFTKAMQDGKGTIEGTAAATDTWQDKLKQLGHGAAIAIAPLATQVFKALGEAVSWASPYIERFTKWCSDNLPGAFASLAGVWRRDGQPVFDKLKSVAETVVAWIVAHWPQISAVFSTVASIAGRVLKELGDVVGTLWDAVKTVFGWVMDNKEVLAGVAVIIGGVLVAAFVAWAAATWAQVAALAAQAVAMVAAYWPIYLIVGVIALLVTGIIYAYDHFKTFRDVVDAVGRFFRDVLWPIIQNVFGGIVTVLENMWAGVQRIVGGLVQFFTGIFNLIRDLVTGKWGKLWGDVVAVFTGVWNTIKGVFQVLWAQVSAPFVVAWDALKGMWQALWDAVTGIFRAVWATITGIFTVAWAAIAAYFTTAWAALTAAWNAVWNAIKGALSAAWRAITTTITVAWAAIAAIFTTAWAALTAAWNAVWNAIKGALSVAWQAITAAVSAGINAVVGFFTGLPGRALGALASLGQSLKGLGSAALGTMKDGISEGWDTVWTFVSGLPDKILGAFGGLGAKLKTVLGDAVHAMWGGIKAAWNWLADHTEFTLPSLHIPGTNTDIGGGSFSLLPHLAAGGVIPGAGAVPVVAHGGEMFLDAAQQAELFALANGAATAGKKSAGLDLSHATFNVTDGRSLDSELRLLSALYGRAAA